MALQDHREKNFSRFPWRITYRTSSFKEDGSPVNILHDFYIPVLKRAVRYDRVAGYFRSSSLAAASQGFSAFVGSQGKARFIVGADLDPEDVKAILLGAEGILTGFLERELEDTGSWPEGLADGVHLLAWMVAKGHLEIKVAFRVHVETGEPIAFDSAEDGYVHMKWALFRDDFGNRIYISGSLNESKTALLHNAENIDVHCDWEGAKERERADQADAEFKALWENTHPSFRVLSLPEAVRQKLIKLSEGVSWPKEIDGTSAVPPPVAPPSSMELLQFALLRDGPKLPGGKYVGMETAPVQPWPHQFMVARRIVDTWPASHLLCDEVGLGKTVEAGLAIRSLYLAGLVKRALICPPASLTQQWQREMATKFLLPFGRASGGKHNGHHFLLPFEHERPGTSLYGPELTIVSGSLLARADRQKDLAGAVPFDLVLIDEAHYLRRQNPTEGLRAHPRYGNYYRVVHEVLRPRTECLLMATATPMQLDAVEVSDLLALCRRVGAFEQDPSLMQAFYEILEKLVGGGRLDEHEWNFLKETVGSVKAYDPAFWGFLKEVLLDKPTQATLDKWMDYGFPPKGKDREAMTRVLFSASPLGRVMQRHTRGLLEVYRKRGELEGRLAQRTVLPLDGIKFNPQEELVYDRLETYCRELARKLADNKAGYGQSSIGFYLSFLRLRFASSLYAIRETLRRRLERVGATLQAHTVAAVDADGEVLTEDLLDEGDDDAGVVASLLKGRKPGDLLWEQERIRAILKDLGDLTAQPSKMQVLLDILEKRRRPEPDRFRQTVVFTRFFDTLTDIVGRLRTVSPRMLLGTYSGQGGQYLHPGPLKLVGVEREIIKQKFLRGEIDVLICTDAAAEGLNLQTADLLVNFDLPWNPMKVEQRIGRIDRIGQQHETVYVSNLCYVGSAEEEVYGRLWKRLTDTGMIVGTQQISLLPVTQEEFVKLSADRGFAAKLEKIAEERAKLFQRRTKAREIPPEELYAIYRKKHLKGLESPPPVDLACIRHALNNSDHLRALGCVALFSPEHEVFSVKNIEGIPDGTLLTTSRETFERGLAGVDGTMHFATYGSPVFEAVLDHMLGHDLPPSIRRLEMRLPGGPAPKVAYAVASFDKTGRSTCRLVTRYSELKDLVIDEERAVTDAEAVLMEKELEQMADEEFRVHVAIPKIEALAGKAALSQKLLNLLVMVGLMRDRQKIGSGQVLFWQEVAAIEEGYKERKSLRIRNLPTASVKKLSCLLFRVEVPTSGETSHVDASPILLRSALDAICREANAMKKKKSELTTDEVLARAEGSIKHLMKSL